MIPLMSDFAVPSGSPLPGGTASGLHPQPGAALPGGAAARDFAGLLNAALPNEQPAAAAAPIATTPELLREPPQPPANRLPRGTIVPDSGTALPDKPIATQPLEPAQIGADTSVETKPAPAKPTDGEDADIAENDLPATASPPPPPSLPPTQQPPPPPPVPMPVPIAAVIPSPANPPAAPPPAPSARLAGRAAQHPGSPPLRSEDAPLPARAVLTDAPDDAKDAPALPSFPASPPADPQPAAAAPATFATAAAAPAQPAAAPATERSELRSPAPQQETTIAAVGELREALRAARPELTLRHAEFGFVSLRVEATGAQDWRAVLASRDPGFVPAIQAALADRTVAAVADTASANTGQNGTGQNGTSDQRYGSSPNGGQGSSQPYLAQSSSRDGGQSSHPQNRQPSTTNAVASRVGEAEAERPGQSERGVFA